MTKSEETRLANLSRKQGFETLRPRELKELKRLVAKKALENPKPAKSKRN
jgi:hypothetical protein